MFFSNRKWINTPLNYIGYQSLRYFFSYICNYLSIRNKQSDLARNGYIVINDFLSQRSLIELQQYFVSSDTESSFDESIQDAGTLVVRQSTTIDGPVELRPSLHEIYNTLSTFNDFFKISLNQKIWLDKIYNTKDACSQNDIHCDTFHAAFKVWYFPFGVTKDQSPLCIYKNTHQFSFKRFFLEYICSISATEDSEHSWRLPKKGFFSSLAGDKVYFTCEPNTFVVANTMAFHHRSISLQDSIRYQVHLSLPREAFKCFYRRSS